MDAQTSTAPSPLPIANCSFRINAEETIATTTSIKRTSADRVAPTALCAIVKRKYGIAVQMTAV